MGDMTQNPVKDGNGRNWMPWALGVMTTVAFSSISWNLRGGIDEAKIQEQILRYSPYVLDRRDIERRLNGHDLALQAIDAIQDSITSLNRRFDRWEARQR